VNPDDFPFCQDECYAEIITTKSIAIHLKDPYGAGTVCNAEVQLRFFHGTATAEDGNNGSGLICGFGLFYTSPSGCGLFLPCSLFFEWLCFFNLQDFFAFGTEKGERKCVNFAEGTVDGNETMYLQHRLYFGCGEGEALVDYPLVATLAPIVRRDGAPIDGWTYTVSNVPSSFYVRISNTVKSFLITGMDVLNGDYELELDDESDCSKSGTELLTFDITAQEYQVSLTSPCTIVPVGSEIAATARLALPPTSAGVVVTIRIPGEIDKSILIDNWVPFGCDGYTEDAYIDHESTECFGNADPILTLTQSPILG